MDIQDKVFMPNSRAERYGENCARMFQADGYADAAVMRRAIRRNLRAIQKTRRRLSDYTSQLPSIDSALMPTEFVWLTDNVYAVEKACSALQAELKGSFRLTKDAEKRLFILEAARALLRTGTDALTPERLTLFLAGVQRERVLSEDECALFLPALRAAAIENIRMVSDEIDRILTAYQEEAADNPFGAEKRIWQAHMNGSALTSLDAYAAAAEKMHKRLEDTIRGSIKLLKTLGNVHFLNAIRSISRVENILQQDPDGTYPKMTEASQMFYRNQIVKTARKRKMPDDRLAQSYLAAAKAAPKKTPESHIGWHIFHAEQVQAPRCRIRCSYLILDFTLPILIAAVLGICFKSLLLTLGTILPLYELTRSLLLYLFSRWTQPDFLPSLALPDGVPEVGTTLAAIALLAADPKQAADHAGLLETYALANRSAGSNVLYGLLADLPDAQSETIETDTPILCAMQEKIDALNAKYGPRFVLIWRKRRYNAADGVWMAYERKRGAIGAVAAFACGHADPDNTPIIYGLPPERVRKVRYLVALDADTAPEPDAIRTMAGAMLHPLNRAVVASDGASVVSGYGILQPHISLDLAAANATLFSRIFAGQGGTDPYCPAGSDICQTLFGDAIFTGKGILDLAAMDHVLSEAIPDNRVLSHDLLEGSFLRTGFLAEASLCDGFPSSVRSFFKRQARWTRGDIQLIPFLFPKIRGKNGETRPNPLPFTAKYRIGDNIRRAETPAAIFLAIAGCCIFRNDAGAAAAVCALAALAAPMLINTMERLRNFTNKVSTRCQSTIYAGFRGGLLLFFSRFLFLPFDAYITVRAIVQALWRLLVTKRNLLEWTTAAEAEKRVRYAKTGFSALLHEYYVFLPAVFSAVLLGLIGRNAMAWLAAAFWLLSPLYSFMLSRKFDRTPELSENDQTFLMENARRIWRFFDDRMAESDHFLPPDNEQIDPCGTIAHRTSPTNIGFGMLAVLSAERLGFIPWSDAEKRLLRIVSALDRMEKYRGHLYNWYRTDTLTVMHPAVISSVDSGNLCAALYAAAEITRGKGNQTLAERMEHLASAADFSALYDKSVHLFRIAVDSSGVGIGGHYDMLASEARLTSYLAIAAGDVPKKHWRSLSRMLSETNGYSGLVSWSGSLFEYLMPNLLMPEIENSLLYEANRYAVYCQQRYAKRRHLPWGISESTFYAFDESLNYQYKAHGVSTLGLKNGLGRELVLSPYSSYLALCVEPAKTIRNLRRLSWLKEIQGKYGMYESVDFTERRFAKSDDTHLSYRVCKTYMAHHMAMSLCAICNLVTDCQNGTPYFVAAFQGRPEFHAYESLLSERVPIHSINVRHIHAQSDLQPRTQHALSYRIFCEDARTAMPRYHLMANTGCTLLTASNGRSRLYSHRAEAYLPDPGVAVLFYTPDGTLSATSAPQGIPARYHCEFTPGHCRFFAETDRLHMQMGVHLTESDQVELREIRIHNASTNRIQGSVVVFLEPLIGQMAEHESHPAFYRMFVSTHAIPGGIAAVRRNGAAVVLASDSEHAVFTSDGDAILNGCSTQQARSFCGNLSSASFGELRRPVLRAAVPAELDPGGTMVLRFAIAMGETAEAAAAGCRHVFQAENRSGMLFQQAAQRLSLHEQDAKNALALLTPLLTGGERTETCPNVQTSQNDLWRLGISGDLPVVLLECYGEDMTSAASEVFRAVRVHKLLSTCGVHYDLCLLTDDGGSYERSGFHLCHSAVHIAGSSGSLGVRGGIHLVDLTAAEEASVAAIRLIACAVLPYQLNSFETVVRRKDMPARRARIWSQPLCNASFGCLSADFGLTHLWYRNARLLKITPLDETSAGERIDCLIDGCRVPLLMGASCVFEQGCTVWTQEISGQTIRAKAFVSPDEAVRLVVIETDGTPITVDWYLAPLLGERSTDQRGVVTQFDPTTGAIQAENPLLARFPASAAAFAASPAPCAAVCSEACYQCGCFQPIDQPIQPGRIAAFRLTGRRIVLSAAAAGTKEEAAQLAARSASVSKAEEIFRAACDARIAAVKRVTIQTAVPPLDRYLNDWVTWQIKGSRLCARSSLYQNGGAIGFRDQLQDASALLMEEPSILRALLLLNASHQYEEGDVQHWFHIGLSDQQVKCGVRTKCSDDLLWLPFFAAEYVQRTGEKEFWHEQAAYLKSAPLGESERERYENASISEKRESLYLHCLRAIRLFLSRGRGTHDLPLILGGDWNDGLNGIGLEGRGESVWLAWFGVMVLRRFAPVCFEMGDSDTGAGLERAADSLWHAAMQTFDQDRFARAYTDDGRTLGIDAAEACKIDSISQSFAWFAANGSESEADLQRMQTALQTALDWLVDERHQIIRLFTPPFTVLDRVGYLGAYPKGVRENGGQYTHAAVWLAMACFRAGRASKGWKLLQMLLPETHDPRQYGGEDFVLAADVYGDGEKNGMCGWSWYTGSAAWFRRAILEEMLGIHAVPDGLRITPNLPEALPVCKCRIQLGIHQVQLSICRSANRQEHFVKLPEGKTDVQAEIK